MASKGSERGICGFGDKKKTAEGGLFGAYWEW